MSDIVKNHYKDEELHKLRQTKESGLKVKVILAMPQPEINCVAVVLENTRMPMHQRYNLYKYFPYTLISDDEKENGKICWGVNKIENTNLDQMFRWLPNPK